MKNTITLEQLLRIREILQQTKKESEEKSNKEKGSVSALYQGHALGVDLAINLLNTILEDK